MLKTYLIKDTDIALIDLKKLLDDARLRKLTGFLHVSYWDRDDFLLLHQGKPVRSVAFHQDGRTVFGDPNGFGFVSQWGTVTLAETGLDDLVGLQEAGLYVLKERGINLFPCGTPVQSDIPMTYLDIDRVFLLAKKSHVDGYAAFYTPTGLIGTVVFQGGEPVGAVGPRGSKDTSGIKGIASSVIPPKSFVTLYTLESDLIPFFLSICRGGVRYLETEEVPEDFSGVVVTGARGTYRYDLFFRGAGVGTLFKERGVFIWDEGRKREISDKIDGLPGKERLVFEVDLNVELKPLEFSPDELKAKEETQEVPAESVDRIKALFVREMGPVGRIIWEKILEEFHLKEGSMTLRQLSLLVDRLKEEFPEEEAKREFIVKVREIVPNLS